MVLVFSVIATANGVIYTWLPLYLYEHFRMTLIAAGFEEIGVYGGGLSTFVLLGVRGSDGRRPVYGGSDKFQSDPNFRDHVLFFEYFHGDNGAGLGASHQTGWTALVAKLLQQSWE